MKVHQVGHITRNYVTKKSEASRHTAARASNEPDGDLANRGILIASSDGGAGCRARPLLTRNPADSGSWIVPSC